jgi:hypothetical protein
MENGWRKSIIGLILLTWSKLREMDCTEKCAKGEGEGEGVPSALAGNKRVKWHFYLLSESMAKI